jgi:sugar lactone lactonase YvrE
MKSDSPVEVVVHVPTILGEGPLWSQQEGVLYWLDIFKPTINCFNPGDGTNRVFDVEEPVYALGLNATGGFIAALDSGFALLSKDGALVKRLSNPIAGRNVNFNDGKVDDKGRFWSGTMARDWKSPIGALYKVGCDGCFQEMDSGMILSNGLAWSPDQETMYFTDFGRKCIYAYDFELNTGIVSARRPFILFGENEGSPDGITVDAEGGIWVAHWDGWCVTRHLPDGTQASRVQVPVPRPTSVMFGGRNLDTLYITSATMHLTNTQLSEAPLSGALFAMVPEVRGLPESQFRYIPS